MNKSFWNKTCNQDIVKSISKCKTKKTVSTVAYISIYHGIHLEFTVAATHMHPRCRWFSQSPCSKSHDPCRPPPPRAMRHPEGLTLDVLVSCYFPTPWPTVSKQNYCNSDSQLFFLSGQVKIIVVTYMIFWFSAPWFSISDATSVFSIDDAVIFHFKPKHLDRCGDESQCQGAALTHTVGSWADCSSSQPLQQT